MLLYPPFVLTHCAWSRRIATTNESYVPGPTLCAEHRGPLAYDARRINAARFSLLTRCASVSACAQPFLGQLASWGSCLDVAEAMEREGRRIDAILTLRADLVWYAPFPIESLRIRHIPYLQSRTEAPLDAKAALRLSQCAMNPGCPIVPHEIGDWVFSVPRRLAHAALGAAREYCDACRRPSEKAFWVPTRVEDFLMARIARGVVRLGRNWTHRMPMLHTMPAVVLRGRSEHGRQERSCSHVPVQRANLMPEGMASPLFAGCAPLLDEACWTHPVTTHDYASRLSKIGDQLGWVTGRLYQIPTKRGHQLLLQTRTNHTNSFRRCLSRSAQVQSVVRVFASL